MLILAIFHLTCLAAVLEIVARAPDGRTLDG
jgi:hypothetical protein